MKKILLVVMLLSLSAFAQLPDAMTANFNNGVQWETPNREFAIFSRWLSPDSTQGGQWNTYAYPTNPNSFTDPTGLGSAKQPCFVLGQCQSLGNFGSSLSGLGGVDVAFTSDGQYASLNQTLFNTVLAWTNGVNGDGAGWHEANLCMVCMGYNYSYLGSPIHNGATIDNSYLSNPVGGATVGPADMRRYSFMSAEAIDSNVVANDVIMGAAGGLLEAGGDVIAGGSAANPVSLSINTGIDFSGYVNPGAPFPGLEPGSFTGFDSIPSTTGNLQGFYTSNYAAAYVNTTTPAANGITQQTVIVTVIEK
jgi:hypothetical protein